MKKIMLTLLLLAFLSPVSASTDLERISARTPADGLFEALEYFGVDEPYIVYSQAVLETGWFGSNLCVNGNNLFGIYDSRNKCYKTYDHWIDSVIDYKERVQRKYNGGDYYEFLNRIGYASDPEYTSKVRVLAEELMEYD